jgi:hypothetical protein
MDIELLVAKAQIIRNVKVNFGNVKDAIKLFVGKKAVRTTWLICVMIVGMTSEFYRLVFKLGSPKRMARFDNLPNGKTGKR